MGSLKRNCALFRSGQSVRRGPKKLGFDKKRETRASGHLGTQRVSMRSMKRQINCALNFLVRKMGGGISEQELGCAGPGGEQHVSVVTTQPQKGHN